MTDLEITKLCVEADGEIFCTTPPTWTNDGLWCFADGAPDSKGFYYDPLHDDAQAMALVKKLKLDIEPCFYEGDGEWMVSTWDVDNNKRKNHLSRADLNRAICECVAKMQAAKGKR